MFFSLLALSGCKKEKSVTNNYTIGNLGHSTTGTGLTDWKGLERYLRNTVKYNCTVTFTNSTVEDNKADAKIFFDSQVNLINPDSVKTYIIKDSEYMVYGIAKTATVDGETRFVDILKSVKLTSSGIRQN